MDIVKHHIQHHANGCKALEMNNELMSSLKKASEKYPKPLLPKKVGKSLPSFLIANELAQLENERQNGVKKLKDAVNKMCKKSRKAINFTTFENKEKAQLAISNLDNECEAFHKSITHLSKQFEILNIISSTVPDNVEANLVVVASFNENKIQMTPNEFTSKLQGSFEQPDICAKVFQHSHPTHIKSLLKHLKDHLSPMEDYTLFGVFGFGGQGYVYQAKCSSDTTDANTTTSPWFALKIIKVSETPRILKETVDEIWLNTSKNVKHPNILSALQCSIFVKLGVYYVALKFEAMVDGSLDKYVKSRLQEPQIACVIQQVLCGLKHLHKQEIIHNDLKTANILISNGVAKIGDLGKSVHRAKYTHDHIGTLHFTAPEIASAILKDDFSSSYANFGIDIWALGGVIYEIVEFETPFATVRTNYVLSTIVKDGLVLSDTANCSLLLKQFFSKCTNRNPSKRPTAEMLLSDLFITRACTQNELAETIKKYAHESNKRKIV